MTTPRTALVVAPPAAPLLALETLSPEARLVRAFLSNRSPRTLEAYRRDLLDFARFLSFTGDDALDQAAAALLRRGKGQAHEILLDYKASLTERLAPATVNRRLAALRSLVHVASLLGLVTWSIEIESLKSQAYRDTRGPGEEGAAAMDAWLAAQPGRKGVRDRAIVRLLYDLGLRRGEVASLDLAHLDGTRLSILGKGRREREWVELPASTRAVLAAWCTERKEEDVPCLFFALDRASYGHRLTGSAIYALVRAAGAATGRTVRPHGLRHAAITSVLERTNGNMRMAQAFGRHANATITSKYDDNLQNLAGKAAKAIALPND